MVAFRLSAIILLFSNLTHIINGATHWVVTENGKIEANFDSPYNIRRPYDLLALLEQEQRLKEINALYSELLHSKKNIDQKLFKLKDISNIGNKLDDYECLTKGKALSNVDFYSSRSMDGNILKEIQIYLKEEYDVNAHKEPDCESYSPLEFGKISFDNLESVKNYENISLIPDKTLEKSLGVSSIKDFGHEVSKALEENSTSWVHYNLASLYWRIKNVGPKAIQCSRRAIYFASHHYRDIPLHMLAGVLHQARDSEDAAELLLAAIDLAPDQPIHLLALGNVYASLAEYNKSIIYYDKYLKVRPDQDVIANKYAALCFWKLENDLWKLENEVADIQKFFQGILMDLQNYHDRQSYWLKLHERSLLEQVSFEKQLVSLNTQGARGTLQLKSLNKKCVQEMMENPDKLISCDITHSNELNEFKQFDMESLFSFIESETQQINRYLAKGKEEILKTKMASVPSEPEKGEKDSEMPYMPKIPDDSGPFYFDDPQWPEKRDCQKWNLPLNEVDNLYLPVYLPLDNKGYKVKDILSSLIGIPENIEHELPWYPPSCDDWDSSDRQLIPSYEKVVSSEFKSNEHLRNHLLGHVNGGKAEEAEIGQRIITAMEKKVAPPWVLGTLASLYWRVRGNHKKALTCLDFALRNVQKQEPTETILVSIASVTHQLGYTDDAIKFAVQAFQQSEAEPSTNFLLALLHYKKNKPLMALYYLKNTLRADRGYYDGQAENLLKIWSCRLKLGAFPEVQNSVRQKVDKTCTDKAATKEEGGEGVICSLKGENCRTAAVQCFRRDSVPDSDVVARKDDQGCVKHQGTNDGSSLQSLLVDHSLTDSDQLLMEGSVQAFHMKISLGDNLAPIVALMDDPIPDVLVQVYEKSGTLLLSPMRCQQIKEAEWVYFTSMWQSIATRNVDIGNYLKPLSKPLKDDMKPYCSRSIPSSPATMDHLTTMILKNRLPNSPEKALLEWLGLMAGDQKASLKELGAKISVALKDNATSWVLANAAGLFWRIVGNTEEAVICLRQALLYVPPNMRDVPLISLANILNRVGFHNDALEAAYTAIKSHPNYVFNHFTAGNIHTAMGDFEKAISFYRASLALDANFAPARNRLLAISCMFLYDESGSLRELTEPSEN
ncbi:tetratricopeptide repeat protein 17 [Coccinella septempunctata]|uniref:tetratricopeptide repeat protein 17 n=1 Tax=Coccinella septempunctata TaxID=41139 RepID=UPI001D06A1C5|nr:tetratricopeptide repeat protein 17 [Coccinella septempunctata]